MMAIGVHICDKNIIIKFSICIILFRIPITFLIFGRYSKHSRLKLQSINKYFELELLHYV